MPVAKPSLNLLRTLTEEHVLRALMSEKRLTRAEIAARTGLSKPTISEGVRRLVDAGLVVDTGEQSSGRGRAGSYFTLSPETGSALVLAIDPQGVTAQVVDAFGTVLADERRPLGRDSGPADAERALAEAARLARASTASPLRLAVVSAADPVDRRTGRLVQLPDAPFLIGDLDPKVVLAPFVNGEVLVDNDVNWAARAERDHGDLPDSADFVYLHLGEGLGCAVVSDGVVSRGHSGVAGEIAHIVTTGPGGRARQLTEVFGDLDLRLPKSTAIDVDRLRARLVADEDASTAGAIASAVAGVLSALVALADPEVVVLGGAWGRDPAFIRALGEEVNSSPRPVRLAVGSGGEQPELTGAREAALTELRSLVVNAVDAARRTVAGS